MSLSANMKLSSTHLKVPLGPSRRSLNTKVL
jgi:hypothetical protein